MKQVLNNHWIDHLLDLREILDPEGIPEQILEEAISANPWFSKEDIQRSLIGIRQWLEPEVLREFLSRYERPEQEILDVGVIAAGNLPLVCMHDIISVLVSGHRLWLKPSSQDTDLIRWILNRWITKSPELAKIFHLAEKLPEVNCLIATGSNNTARYLESEYGDIPRLIRKNRFSVALLGDWTTEEDVRYLMEDVFSYNGLGCRNVSNVILFPGFSETIWEKSLRDFPRSQLHPLYLERYLSEKTRREMQREYVRDASTILRIPATDLRYASMAIIHELSLNSLDEWEDLAHKHQDRIQCVVGSDIPYGKAQYPDIDDFADGVDTIQWLLNCRI